MFATLFDDPDLINRMLDRYLSVTAERIQEVAAAVFRVDNRAVLTYVPDIPPADAEVLDQEPEQPADATASTDEEVAA
jgi:hypothetical protein